MSRVGKQPVTVPAGVKASVGVDGIVIEGPKGRLVFNPASGVTVALEGGQLIVRSQAETKQIKSNFGTARAILLNMVKGVSVGWKRTLEMNGVGFTAKIQGQVLTLAVGFSHDVVIELPKNVNCTIQKNIINLESCDRETVGLMASKIRKVQPPEPYLGKGIKYAEEVVRRKAGKAGKK